MPTSPPDESHIAEMWYGVGPETLPRLLRQVARRIEPPQPFIAATSNRTVRLAAPDFIAPLVPAVLRDIHAEAPEVRVELAPYSATTARDLANGRYDALIGSARMHSTTTCTPHPLAAGPGPSTPGSATQPSTTGP